MILVTGATGNVGRPLVDELVKAGAEVCALSRDPERAGLPAGVRVLRTGDMPLDGVTSLFLNAALLWNGGVDEFLEKAKWHGVRRVVLLSSSSVTEGGSAEENPIGALHDGLEKAVEASGLEWTHLRPGYFAANALGWAEQIRRGDVVHGPYAGAHMDPIHEADIAAVAARALLTDDLVGRAPKLTGPQSLTFAEMVRLIGEALGRPVRYEEVPAEAAREAMLSGGHMTEAMADSLLRIFREATERPAELSPEVERITARPARTFAEWAAEHTEAFGRA